MNVERDALKRLVAPTLTAIGLIAAGVAALAASQKWLAHEREAEQAVRAERAAVQQRLARATQEELEIMEKLVSYNQLVARGVIGDEKRLDWVDAIAAIKNERKLFEVKYSIDPQRTLDLASVKGGGDVEFLTSRMRLELPLLHEGDLFTFLGDLERRIGSHVLVRSCAIQRADRSGAERGAGPRLRGDCVIDLVTIRDKRRSVKAFNG